MNLKETPTLSLDDCAPFALVLCGGGAAGRWQAGVLVGLAQAGVIEKASVIVGTSVGGLNAGLFSIYGGNLPPMEKLSEDIGENILPPPPGYDPNAGRLVLDPSIEDTVQPPWHTAIEVWEEIKRNEDVYKGRMDLWGKIGAGIGFLFNTADSILDASPLRSRLDRIFGELRLGDIPDYFDTHLIISSLDLNTHREEFYCSFNETRDLKISEVLKRTSAIPGVFSSVLGKDPMDAHEHWHVDGGLGANNPFIALGKYNAAFPNAPVKKAIIVYCYPDEDIDTGVNIITPESTKRFKTMREVLLECIPASLNAQEQITELNVEDKVRFGGWDVLALYPKKTPCDALDFTKLTLLQEGYDYVVEGKGYSYKDKAEINIVDFLKRK